MFENTAVCKQREEHKMHVIALAGVVQWVEVPACKPKGRQFDSQSGHMPGLRATSPVGGTREATTDISLPFFHPSPLSKNKNK